MSYATIDDLAKRTATGELQDLTDRGDPPIGAVDQTIVQDALDGATAEINGYLAIRLQTPVQSVTAILVTHTCSIARYRLWNEKASDRVRQDYQDAIAWAKGVGAGTIALGDVTAPTEAPTQGSPRVVANERIFTRKKLRSL